MSGKNKNIEIGKKGEDMAAEYLAGHGYEILERNYRAGRVEIDIIARHGKIMVFVEVKTRTSEGFGYPEESVDETKQDCIQTCAEEYMVQTGWEGEIRFDIIAVNLKQLPDIRHFKDAF